MKDPWPSSLSLFTRDRRKTGDCGVSGLLSKQLHVLIIACHEKMAAY